MSDLGNKQVFAENLRHYIEQSGKKQIEVAEECGVAQSTFNDWVNAKKYPRIDKIEMLAGIFKILKSDLIERKNDERREMQKKNDTLSDIVVKLRTDEELFAVVDSICRLDSEKLIAVKSVVSALLK